MSKRLILVLALAFVVGIAFAAYAEVQNVKVSGDLTVLGIMRELSLKDRGYGSDNVHSSLVSIARVKVDADLTDNVMATVRLLNERYWGTENENEGTDNNPNTDVSLDLAYVTLREFLYSPMTLIVGRQELHFGNEMIIGDVDTNNVADIASPFSWTNANNRDADLSARKAFDAIRITLNYDPLVIDALMSKVTENSINLGDEVNLYGINANYALNKTTTLEGYWFEKRTTTNGGINPQGSKSNTIDTLGARIAAQPIDNLSVGLEGAMQLGKYYDTDLNNDVRNRRAWAAEGMVNYALPEMKYTPTIGLLAGYFSGEARDYTGDTKNYRAWDPMFENQKFGDIANALFQQTNVKLIGVNASVKPVEDVTLKGEYYYFWWNKHYNAGETIDNIRDTGSDLVMTSRKQAGQELDLTAVYDYTEDVQFGLLYGTFFPGESFHKNNRKPASELIGSMKVTF